MWFRLVVFLSAAAVAVAMNKVCVAGSCTRPVTRPASQCLAERGWVDRARSARVQFDHGAVGTRHMLVVRALDLGTRRCVAVLPAQADAVVGVAGVAVLKTMEEVFRGRRQGTPFSAQDATIKTAAAAWCADAVPAKLKYGEISNWDTTKVKDMGSLFKDCTFNDDINSWDVSLVTSLQGTFKGASKFNRPLESWRPTDTKDFGGMFSEAEVFNQNIDSWETLFGANSVAAMFKGAAAFNQPLNSWRVVTVETEEFQGMFSEAEVFNQDIDSWEMSSATSVAAMFKGAAAFNQPLNSWRTYQVENMAQMFEGKYDGPASGQLINSFNQDIDSWTMDTVRDTSAMFKGTAAFDQPLNSWRTDQVENMGHMFAYARRFNKNIDSWRTDQVSTLGGLLPRLLPSTSPCPRGR